MGDTENSNLKQAKLIKKELYIINTLASHEGIIKLLD